MGGRAGCNPDNPLKLPTKSRLLAARGSKMPNFAPPRSFILVWAVKAGDFDAPFAVQGGVCVVTCHLNAQENSLHGYLGWP